MVIPGGIVSYRLSAYEDDVLGTEHPLWQRGVTRRGRDVIIRDGRAFSRILTGATERDSADAFYQGGYDHIIPDEHAELIIMDLDRASWLVEL